MVNFIKKYKYILVLLVFFMVFGEKITQRSIKLSSFVDKIEIENVTLEYIDNDNIRKVDLNKKSLENFKETFGLIKVKKIKNSLSKNKSEEYFLINIKTSDVDYKIEIDGKKSLKLVYKIDGEENTEYYKIVSGLNREDIFKVFGV